MNTLRFSLFSILAFCCFKASSQDLRSVEHFIPYDSIRYLIRTNKVAERIRGPWEESIFQNKNCSNGIIFILDLDPMVSGREVRKKLSCLSRLKRECLKLGIPEERIFIELRKVKRPYPLYDVLEVRRAILWKITSTEQIVN